MNKVTPVVPGEPCARVAQGMSPGAVCAPCDLRTDRAARWLAQLLLRETEHRDTSVALLERAEGGQLAPLPWFSHLPREHTTSMLLSATLSFFSWWNCFLAALI